MADRDREDEGRSVGGRSVVVATVETAIEAAIAEGALKEAGIPAMVRSFHDSAYNGLFTFHKGYGRVLVPSEYADRAAEIVRAALEESESVDEDGIADP